MQFPTVTIFALLLAATSAIAQNTGACGLDDYQGQYFCIIEGVVSFTQSDVVL